MKKITILSHALTQQCVDSFQAIVSDLSKRGYEIEHIGITESSTLKSVRQAANDAYHKLLKNVYALPNIDEDDFIPCVENIINRHHPTIFLTDNERIISIFLIHYLQEKNIPSVMVDHGYLSKPPFFYLNPVFRLVKHELDIFKKNMISQSTNSDLKQKAKLLMNCPPGTKGNYPICAAGGLNKTNYLRYGVDAKRISVTGFPYLDHVISYKKSSRQRQDVKNDSGNRKKILIISSGIGMLSGQKEDAEKFINFVITIARLAGENFDIILRFKPGENIFSMLSTKTLSQLKSANLRFDDSSKKSYFSVVKSDLVMGDASTVLFEAVIFNKPVIVFRYSKIQSYDNDLNYFFRKRMGFLIMENPFAAEALIKKALTSSYRRFLAKRLKENEYHFFCNLNGRAAERVGEIITKSVFDVGTNR